MKKTDAGKLKKGQRVFYGGYEWKVYKACPYVNGIDTEAYSRLKSGDCDGYRIWLKAIDGLFYPLGGQYAPKDVPLDKQYWRGVEANYKDVTLK